MADRPPNYPGEQGPGIDHTLPPKNPNPPIVEKEVAEGSTSSDLDQSDADISHKQFRYNPPMHSANLSKRVDLGNVGLSPSTFYDERTAPSGYTEKWAKEGLNTLRLGRIIQHHQAPGQVSQMKYRWGFRFLYNPSSVSYVSSRNDSFIIDPRSETNRVLSGVFQNFQSVSFTVLLDRVPDVMSGIPDRAAYSPSLSKSDRDGILRYGTHWDMEALFKICNGEWNLTDRGKTANIGVLMPSNARLLLGPGVNLYGFVGSVTWKDEMFSANMVPTRTRLDIVFRRHVDMTAEQAEKSFPGIASSDINSGDDAYAGEDTDSGGGSTAKVNALLPSGYRNGRSTDAAVAYALGRVGIREEAGYCLRWVGRQVFQRPADGGSIAEAHQVWDNAPSNLKFRRDWGAPRGAVVLWNSSIGGGAGHIAISLGNGKMVTTTSSKIAVVNIRGYSDRAYLGWMPPYFRSRKS